jgi:hypothetical protein
MLLAQDTASHKTVWAFNGYLKDLQWIRLNKDFSKPVATNLIHNRFNLKWNKWEQWVGRLEIRNRLYWGGDVREQPGFKEQLRNQSEAVNLSVNWYDARSAILHSNLERCWIEFKKPKWNVRAGRQRINWGITNTWSPNDIFNSYNFLDFDYEERPGSDAIKTQYLLNELSHLELAVAGTRNKPIIAANYFTNYRQYDLQANTGFYQGNFTAGLGWAGNIKNAGFKGEAQFHSSKKDGLSNLLVVLEGDYMFKNGWYVSTTFLFNDKGWDKALDSLNTLVFQVSPRNLMPTKWNFLVNTSKEITPILSGSMSLVYAPGTNLLILFPTLRYNIQTNLDLDFVWQSFFASANRFQALSHIGFLRVKWSF